MNKHVLAALLTAGGLLIGSYRVALAAHLEEQGQQMTKDASPAQSVLGPTGLPVCEGSATNNGDIFVDPTLHAGSIRITSAASNVAKDPTCNLSDTATFQVDAAFIVVPDPGENLGDPVTFCLEASYDQAASATGNYTALSTIGGFNLTLPSQIILNPMGANVTVFTYGPNNLSSGANRQGFSRDFFAQVGDVIELTLGTGAVASGTGVGSASAYAAGRLGVRMGSCAQQAPAISRLPLALLALLLALAGAACVWRMQARQSAASVV